MTPLRRNFLHKKLISNEIHCVHRIVRDFQELTVDIFQDVGTDLATVSGNVLPGVHSVLLAAKRFFFVEGQTSSSAVGRTALRVPRLSSDEASPPPPHVKQGAKTCKPKKHTHTKAQLPCSIVWCSALKGIVQLN